MKKQVELSITHNGKDVVAYPYSKKEHVQFENGMNIDEFVGQDIATPTITHDTTAIKVGVGDSDVSGSVVDGAVNMTIKGQTYQNILPEPTLRNEMQGKSMQRLNEGYDNVEVVDGVSKSAILKGQTLVNVNKMTYPTTWYTNPNNNNYYRDNLTLRSGMVKSSTKYLLKIYGLSKPNEIRLQGVSGVFASSESQWRFSVNGGLIVTTVASAQEVENLTPHFKRDDVNNLTDKEMQDFKMIILEYQEGMENWDIPYFEGMTSCKMPVLKSIGKNLLNHHVCNTRLGAVVKNITNNSITFTAPQPWAGLSWVCFLEPNQEYTVSFKTDLTIAQLKGYVRFPNTNQNATGGSHKFSFRTDSTGKIQFTIESTTASEADITVSDVQIEKGSAATPYEPYKSNILTVNEEVELRGIGDVKDTLDCLTGELTQRIGEVVLDGSEDWVLQTVATDARRAIYRLSVSDINPTVKNDSINCICDKGKVGSWTTIINSMADKTFAVLNNQQLRVQFSGTLEELKTWLSEEQPTIQYLKTASVKTVDLSILDQNGGTQENLHSFANGHLQVSSEAENSLLPSVQYEIPTKNSYHMDLMKTNTLYTMKAKTVSGTFTIDGTSYNVNANGTFTSPSSMTDKLLVMSNKTNEEVMLLEGNVIDKTIPYFKGIKSAFEGKDKIEVLSTGKNLFDMGKIVFADFEFEKYQHSYYGKAFHFKPNTTYTIVPYLTSEILDTTVWTVFNVFVNGQKIEVINVNKTGSNNHNTTIARVFTTDSTGEVGFSIYAHNGQESSWLGNLPFSIIMTESRDEQPYEPYKSNSTKIPLLSPLRSLPNGVCDEIILDRENNKAKIIQRVGKVILDGSENWGYTPDWVKGETIGFYLLNDKSNGFCLSDKFIFYHGINSVDHECVSFPKNAWLGVRIKVDKLGTQDVDGFKQYLQQNPLTVYYDLATPIVTEIDLEGYPYVYKDGHIFLNSEVAPTTEIIYSINQAQQIESANENLQRHEKEISHLQKLIAQYIQVEYESTLLSLKI